ncbi:MAG: glutamine--tRNA ligase, partial [Spirochaetales bacterium]|nr:glutamine--tRNA ligase [Spirochaetales bacterium]
KRVMAVLDPLKVVITNYPEDKTEMMEADNNPEDENMGKREVPFSREIYIEKDDFMEDPPKKYFRLSPGKEVRLKHAYYVTCTDVVKDPDSGEIIEVHCTYDPESKGGGTADGRKVKGTSHWVSAKHAFNADVRLYSNLFESENPEAATGKFLDDLASDSLEILTGCKLEPSLADAVPGDSFQFMRKGYFCADTVDSKPGVPVFNRTVSMRDTWAKLQRDAAKKAKNNSAKGN